MTIIKWGDGHKWGDGSKWGQQGTIYDETVALAATSALSEAPTVTFSQSVALPVISALSESGFQDIPVGISLPIATGLAAEVQTLIERLLSLNAGVQVDPGGHATLDAALSLILSSGLSAGEQVWDPHPVLVKQLALQVAIPGITAVVQGRELTPRPQTSRIEVTCDG